MLVIILLCCYTVFTSTPDSTLWWQTYHKIGMMIHTTTIGGSKGGARDAPGVQILSFSCSFRQKVYKIIPLWELASPPGKSWIRHCYDVFIWKRTNLGSFAQEKSIKHRWMMDIESAHITQFVKYLVYCRRSTLRNSIVNKPGGPWIF